MTVVRVALTGSTGFIGSRVVQRLETSGHEVCMIRRNDVLVRSRGTDTVVASEVDAVTIAAALEEFQADVVVHLATKFVAQHEISDVDDLVKANVLFGASLLEAAARVGAPVLNINSFWQHVHGQLRSPNSFYAATKNALLAITDYYRDRGDLRIDDLVLYDVYGEGDTRRKLLMLLIDAAKSGEAIELSSGRQLINLLHVDDVVEGILHEANRLMGSEGGACYAVRASEFLTIREVAETVEAALSMPIDARWGARADRPGEMRDPWFIADVLPGWNPSITLLDGVRRIAEKAVS
jgi:nucleoside-diphosphate-sugar epimerase